MIEYIQNLEGKIVLYINTEKDKNLDCLLQQVIYRPKVELTIQLQKKILRMRKNKQLQTLKETLKNDYFISYVKEDPYLYRDVVMPNLYQIVWKKQKFNLVPLQIGQTIFHLAKKDRITDILNFGLIPTNHSEDGVFYGHNKIFFLTEPLLDENEPYIDPHLKNRVQVEIKYDGTYEVYVDTEYSHHKVHPMVYVLTDTPIRIKGISPIQPKPYCKQKIVS